MRFSRAWIRGFVIGVISYLIVNAAAFLIVTGPFLDVSPFRYSDVVRVLLGFLIYGPLAIFLLAGHIISPITYQILAISALVLTALIYGLIGAYISTYEMIRLFKMPKP